jgi:tRNA(Ile)-lysidine synthase
MALMLLAAKWAERHGGCAIGLTVDHRLRPGSTAEARQVARWLAAREIPHHTLKLSWPAGKPEADIQATAREHRYRRLADWCRTRSVLHLLTAHHLEDQAETLLLRLGRGSGVEGLASIPLVTERAHFRILRPLLGSPKLRLSATLARVRQGSIDDPTNQDTRHRRVALRAALPAMADHGLTTARLADTAAAMARARNALARQSANFLSRNAVIHGAGFLHIHRPALADLPDEIAMRTLSKCLSVIAGRRYGARLQSLVALLAACRDGSRPVGRTLAGCTISSHGSALYFGREPSATAAPIRVLPGDKLLWDGRFEIQVPQRLPAPVYVGALSAIAKKNFKQARLSEFPFLRKVPSKIVGTMPVIAKGGAVYLPNQLAGAGSAESRITKARSKDAALAAQIVKIRFTPPQSLTNPAHQPCEIG